MFNEKVVLAACGITGLALGCVSTGFAQEEMVTDRPDFTESAVTIPKGRVQLETGYVYTRTGNDTERGMEETLLRIGLSDRVELRVGIPNYIRVTECGVTRSDFDDSFLGMKWVLRKGNDGGAGIALLAGTTLPTGSRAVAEHKAQPEAVFVVEGDLSDKISAGINLGMGRPSDGGQRFNQVFGSATVGYDFTDKLGGYVEVYAFNRTEAGGSTQKYFNTGLTYLTRPDLQFDARVGFGLGNGNGRDRYYGVGVSKLF